MSSIVTAAAHPNLASLVDYMLAGKTTSLNLRAAGDELARVLNPEHVLSEIRHLLALPSELHHGHARFSINAGRRLRHIDVLHFHDGARSDVMVTLHRPSTLPDLSSYRISQNLCRTLGDTVRGRGLLSVTGANGAVAALAASCNHLEGTSLLLSKTAYKPTATIDTEQPSDLHDIDHLLASAQKYQRVFIEGLALNQAQIAGLLELAATTFIALDPGISGAESTLRHVARSATISTEHNLVGTLSVNGRQSKLLRPSPEYHESLRANFEPVYRLSHLTEVV